MARLEYMILESEGSKSRSVLEALVNSAISEGWEPQGGVMVSEANINNCSFVSYHQAMIRRLL